MRSLLLLLMMGAAAAFVPAAPLLRSPAGVVSHTPARTSVVAMAAAKPQEVSPTDLLSKTGSTVLYRADGKTVREDDMTRPLIYSATSLVVEPWAVVALLLISSYSWPCAAPPHRRRSRSCGRTLVEAPTSSCS